MTEPVLTPKELALDKCIAILWTRIANNDVEGNEALASIERYMATEVQNAIAALDEPERLPAKVVECLRDCARVMKIVRNKSRLGSTTYEETKVCLNEFSDVFAALDEPEAETPAAVPVLRSKNCGAITNDSDRSYHCTLYAGHDGDHKMYAGFDEIPTIVWPQAPEPPAPALPQPREVWRLLDKGATAIVGDQVWHRGKWEQVSEEGTCGNYYHYRRRESVYTAGDVEELQRKYRNAYASLETFSANLSACRKRAEAELAAAKERAESLQEQRDHFRRSAYGEGPQSLQAEIDRWKDVALKSACGQSVAIVRAEKAEADYKECLEVCEELRENTRSLRTELSAAKQRVVELEAYLRIKPTPPEQAGAGIVEDSVQSKPPAPAACIDCGCTDVLLIGGLCNGCGSKRHGSYTPPAAPVIEPPILTKWQQWCLALTEEQCEPIEVVLQDTIRQLHQLAAALAGKEGK